MSYAVVIWPIEPYAPRISSIHFCVYTAGPSILLVPSPTHHHETLTSESHLSALTDHNIQDRLVLRLPRLCLLDLLHDFESLDDFAEDDVLVV